MLALVGLAFLVSVMYILSGLLYGFFFVSFFFYFYIVIVISFLKIFFSISGLLSLPQSSVSRFLFF